MAEKCISDVLMTPREWAPTDIFALGVKKPQRLQLLASVLGEDALAGYSAEAILAAVDGAYVLSPAGARDLDRLAQAVAATDLPYARMGRGTVFAKSVGYYRK